MAKVKKRFKISGMHCTSCAMLIEGDLEELSGVESAKASYIKSEVEVEFLDDLVGVDKILEIVKKSGYQIEPIS